MAGGPREFTYGYGELAAAGAPVTMLSEDDLGLDKHWPSLIERAAARVSQFSNVHPRVLVQLYKARADLDRFAYVFATTHSLGLALAALARLGLTKTKPVIFTMGLNEAAEDTLRWRWQRWLLKDSILASLSLGEAPLLRARLGRRTDVRDFTFGVDLEFWSPSEEATRDNVVLSVGNDLNRDFATLIAAWQPDFPPLHIITSLPISSEKSNVVIERGDWRSQSISDEDLRGRLRRARLVIVPVHNTIQPSGQSATLQAMACARPVVLSAARGLWSRDLIQQYGACVLVPPGDVGAMQSAVGRLLSSPEQAEAMGRRARGMLEAEDITSVAMARQVAAITTATVRA